MKRISFKKVTVLGKKYIVNLGNGYSFEFSNLVKAKEFNSRASKFFTDALYNLNFCYSIIEEIYRLSWGYFRNNKKISIDKIKLEKNVNESIETCQVLFEKIANHPNTENYNSFVYGWLFSLIDNQLKLSYELKALNASQNNLMMLKKIQFNINQIQSVRSALMNYESENAVSFNEPRMIEHPESINLKIVNQ
jgi:hypothetical protein